MAKADHAPLREHHRHPLDRGAGPHSRNDFKVGFEGSLDLQFEPPSLRRGSGVLGIRSLLQFLGRRVPCPILLCLILGHG